jgi:hypothetical protein
MENLLPVIVGGLIGLAGGFIGPWFLQKTKDASERKKHRAEKFEELVQTVYEHQFWLNNVKDIRVFAEKREEPPSPFAKLESIAMVYFPQFLPSIPELDKLSDAYEMWMREGAKKRLAGRIRELSDGIMEVYNPYSKQLISFLAELRTYAKTEFE